jgi:class 3 adenylate cyclase
VETVLRLLASDRSDDSRDSDLQRLERAAAAARRAGLAEPVALEVLQAYARAVGRIVAAEADIAGRPIEGDPVDSYPVRREAWLATVADIGAEVFDCLHRNRLASIVRASDRPPRSGRATVALVDLCGSTGYLLDATEADARALIDELFYVAQTVAHDHEVDVVKYLGDGVLLQHHVPPTLVDATLALVAALGARLPMPASAGVCHGRVVAHAGDSFGAAVGLASRLAEVARPTEVLLDLEDWPACRPGGTARSVPLRGIARERLVLSVGAS